MEKEGAYFIARFEQLMEDLKLAFFDNGWVAIEFEHVHVHKFLLKVHIIKRARNSNKRNMAKQDQFYRKFRGKIIWTLAPTGGNC